MNRKFKLVLAFALGFSALEANAQGGLGGLSVGATAPDFTLKDTKGVTHNLYTYLNSGKAVVIDIFATWCGPCWSYHGKGALETFYETNGPEGTNKGMSFMVEADDKTNTACLSGKTGCDGGTIGNWLNGTVYPILDPSGTDVTTFGKNYKVYAFPTIYLICPDKKIVYRGQGTAATLQSNMTKSCVTTSALDAGIASHVSVYPNISSGNLYVNVKSEGPAQVRIDIYNAMGEAVFTQDANAAGSKEFGFDLTAQRNGFYFVKVKTAAGVLTRKIVLER